MSQRCLKTTGVGVQDVSKVTTLQVSVYRVPQRLLNTKGIQGVADDSELQLSVYRVSQRLLNTTGTSV